MIKILIDEINKIKKICNEQSKEIKELKNMNEDKDNQIKEIRDKILRDNGINLVYECDKVGDENVFGEHFVRNNKDNISLVVNGFPPDLYKKMNLRRGQNKIRLIIKNEIENLSYMFYDCKNLKNIDELKYLNTSKCYNFSYMFYGCSSLNDIKSIENWNVSNGNNFSLCFMDVLH